MKDKLEQFVISHRNEFDVLEPNPKIWERIKNNTQKQKKMVFPWRKIMWRAAAVIVIFVTAFGLSEYLHIRNNISLTGRNEVVDTKKIPELAEAESYYSSLINNRLGEVKILLNKNPEMQNEIVKDFAELDKIYDELKNDLKDNIANDDIINAMIQNYRLKLEILEDILNELHQQNKKQTNDENI